MIDCRKCQYDPICHVPQKHETGCENYKEADPDVVRVVRCKDCKYVYPTLDGRMLCGAMTNPNWVSEDHFCGYGERRADNG